MVVFTCNVCGDSVKKSSVEKHYQTRCRGIAKNVSCMDCQKDFFGEDYVTHTKCISEAEKYSGKDYVTREPKNRNVKKQESWMSIIRAILDSDAYNLTPPVRKALQRLQSVNNVPRKKAKFENFMWNCMHMSQNKASEVWEVLEQELEKMKQARTAKTVTRTAVVEVKQQNGNKRTATTNDHENKEAPPVKKKIKDKENSNLQVENGSSTEGVTAVLADKFDWNTELAKIANKYKEQNITLEKLKKKLLKKYIKKMQLNRTLTEKQVKKFEKKFQKHIQSCSAVQVIDKLVKAI